MRIVTTYNPAHWGLYVERNIESWARHIPAEIVVYQEEDRPIDNLKVVRRKLIDIPGLAKFQASIRDFKPAHGKFGAAYDYNFDAWKFSRKVYAQCDAATEDTDILIWLDSDVFVERDIPAELWRELLEGQALATYQRPWYHSETGIVIWNNRHPQTRTFFNAYRGIYDDGMIFRFSTGWHDCWALDAVVENCKIGVADLTLVSGENAPDGLHVVPSSVLGEYLRHDKGKRKFAA